jgi:hypothetical protein
MAGCAWFPPSPSAMPLVGCSRTWRERNLSGYRRAREVIRRDSGEELPGKFHVRQAKLGRGGSDEIERKPHEGTQRVRIRPTKVGHQSEASLARSYRSEWATQWLKIVVSGSRSSARPGLTCMTEAYDVSPSGATRVGARGDVRPVVHDGCQLGPPIPLNTACCTEGASSRVEFARNSSPLILPQPLPCSTIPPTASYSPGTATARSNAAPGQAANSRPPSPCFRITPLPGGEATRRPAPAHARLPQGHRLLPRPTDLVTHQAPNEDPPTHAQHPCSP